MAPEDFERYDLEHTFMRSSKHYRRRHTRHMGSEPVRSGDTPPVPGIQPGKPELPCHNSTYGMAAAVVGCGPARPISKPSGQRARAALLELIAKNVSFHMRA
jgi:hypothetical protein